MWAAKLVKKLAETDPEKRRLYAARILIGSIVGLDCDAPHVSLYGYHGSL